MTKMKTTRDFWWAVDKKSADSNAFVVAGALRLTTRSYIDAREEIATGSIAIGCSTDHDTRLGAFLQRRQGIFRRLFSPNNERSIREPSS